MVWVDEGVEKQYGDGANAAGVCVPASKTLQFCCEIALCICTHLSCLATSPSSLVSMAVSTTTRSPVTPMGEGQEVGEKRSSQPSLEKRERGDEVR